MFDRLRALVSGAAAPCYQDCTACPAEPGSVTPHSHHVLVRLPPPEGAAVDTWWPERVDDQPAIVAVNAALAAHAAQIQGKVKVTAFDLPAAARAAPPPSGTCDLLIFPACLRIAGVAVEAAGEAAVAALAQGASDGGDQERVEGVTLLVCTHKARDARCGALGPPLAAALTQLGASVCLSSHVGGHKWAGNVILYGLNHPAHGHWFGGLSAPDAPAFFAALRALPVGADPAADPALRGWWRGRSGLTKAEQLDHFARCAAGARDIEDAGAGATP